MVQHIQQQRSTSGTHIKETHSRLAVVGLIRIYTPGKVVVRSGALKGRNAK